MYYWRKDILNIYNQRAIARQVGLTYETMNRIFTNKQPCKKTTAYCITKIINQDAEIEDFFIRKEKQGE